MAQSKFGVLVGIQPVLRNQMEQPSRDETSDFPVFFMKHFTAGVFFRHDYTKHFYIETELNASIDAEWGYVSDGTDVWNEFYRAFDSPNRIHVDIPIYFGWYVLKKDALKVRVFGCPQYKIRANTAFDFSPIAWNNFSINVGAGLDVLSFLAFNLNYRIPFNYGETSFPETRIAATLGIIF